MELRNVEVKTPIYFRGTKDDLVKLLEQLPVSIIGINPSGKFELKADKGLGKIIYIEPKNEGYITSLQTEVEVTVDPTATITGKITTFYYNNQRFELNHGYRPPHRLPTWITLH